MEDGPQKTSAHRSVRSAAMQKIASLHVKDVTQWYMQEYDSEMNAVSKTQGVQAKCQLA